MRASAMLFAGVLAVYLAMYAVSGVPDPGAADGHYAFLYARSVVFDGDLDFRNDYALCGDAFGQGVDRGTGRVDNPAYPGPALVWAPLLAAARVFVSAAPDADAAIRAGCHGPLARTALAVAMPLGALAIVLSYRAARRVAAPSAALTAAVLFAFASSLPQYAGIFVSSSHVFECVFAAMCVWSSLWAAEHGGGGAWRWAVVSLSLFALTMQRLPDAVFALLPLSLIAGSMLSRRQKLTASALVVSGAACGLALMLALYTHLYGSPSMLPQGRHYLHVTHAHPFLLLFAPQGGLLYTTPSAYLAFAGLVAASCDVRYRRVALAAGAIMVVCVWMASSPLDWHAKATFGARRLIVLTPLFVVFAARALQLVVDRVPLHVRRFATAVAAVLVLGLSVPVLGAAMGTTTGQTPLDAAPLRAPTAGRPYRAMAALGEMAILPATWFYATRFHVPRDSFGFATTDLFYRRSYRDLSWEPNTLEFSAEALGAASHGTERRPTGLAVIAPDAAVVFTAGWPFADRATLHANATAPGSLALSLSTTWGRCELGTHHLRAGPNDVVFTIPPGCFDSGLVALGFRPAAPVAPVIERLTLHDSRPLSPPF